MLETSYVLTFLAGGAAAMGAYCFILSAVEHIQDRHNPLMDWRRVALLRDIHSDVLDRWKNRRGELELDVHWEKGADKQDAPR